MNLDEHPFWWLLPILVLLAVFYLWPAVDVLRLSFTDAKLSEPSYRLTLETYRSAFADADLAAIIVATAIFVSGSVIVQTVFGLLIALTLQAGFRRKLIGVRAVQVAVLATWIIPGVSSGITWQLLLSEAHFGFFNAVLNLASLPSVAWLSDPRIAIWSATLANIWRGTALSMILLYAGLQTIPPVLYEAAAVDGATAFQSFRHITLTSLKPILLVNVMIVSVFSLNAFDLVLPLTGGGPGRSTEVLALAAYNAVFHDFNLAQGSVLAVLMLLINLAVATAIWKIWR
ncbi:carbohydrate ABC transporter permease [Bradyrhizobium sp. McL0616]|uniref:carbohydrate ABC transporter permease n=1 Tax=Bradyrhizobium sp. McL0616 TaxID=3415674 RepID=UPI003CF3E210